jgi:hypothetical protein
MAKGQKSVMDESYILNRFIGVTAGVGLVSYTGSFLLFGDEVDCDPYNFKTNTEFQTNFLFGLRAGWEISRHFDFCVSLLYKDRSAKFDPLDYAQPEYISDERPFELVNVKHDLNVKINMLSISPMIKYRPFYFDFGILVGTSFAFLILDELDSKKWITQPADVVYKKTGESQRSIYFGEIESKNSLMVDLKFGLSCGFIFEEQIKLSPEVFYVYPLTKVCSEDNWKISSIQFLVNLLYEF